MNINYRTLPRVFIMIIGNNNNNNNNIGRSIIIKEFVIMRYNVAIIVAVSGILQS